MSIPKLSVALDKIRMLRRLSREKEIVAIAKAALASFPEEASLWGYLASALKQLEQYDEALRAAEAACALPSADDFPFRVRAGILQALSRYADALAVARAGVARRPESALAYATLADVARDMGELQVEARALDRALELDPRSTSVLSKAGANARVQAQYARAEELYRRGLSINADDAWLHLGLANTLDDVGRYDQAIDHYRRAIGINPRLESFHSSLGNGLIHAERTTEAIAAFTAGRAAFPNSMSFVRGLVRALEAELRFDEARALAEETVRKRPKDPEAWTVLAYRFAAEADVVGAATQVLALRRRPVDLRAASFVMLFVGRYEEALALAREATGIEGGSARGWELAFWASHALGDIADAQRSARRMIELTPGKSDGHRLLSRIEMSRPDRSLDRVAHAATEIIERFPDDVAAWEELAADAFVLRDPARLETCRTRLQALLDAGRLTADDARSARRTVLKVAAYRQMLDGELDGARERWLLACPDGEPDTCLAVCFLGVIAARTGAEEVARQIQRRERHGKRRARRCPDPRCLYGRELDIALLGEPR